MVAPAAVMVLVDVVNAVLSVSLTRGYLGFPEMGFRGIATTQEICAVRRLASEFTMQRRKSSPSLWQLRYSRQYWQLRN